MTRSPNMDEDAEEFKVFYNTIIEGFMIGDLQVAIDGKANFLAACGLLIDSEVLGWLISGGKCTRETAFYEFINLMPSSYHHLPRKNPSTYSLLRNNLLHRYGLTTRGNIQMPGPLPNGCGIEVRQSGQHHEVHVYVQQFFEDFKEAAQRYRDGVISNPDGAPAQNFQRLLPKLDKNAWHPENPSKG